MDFSYVFLNSSNPHLSDAIEHDELPPTPPMESIFIQSDTENTSDDESHYENVESVPVYNFPKLKGDFVTHNKFNYFGKSKLILTFFKSYYNYVFWNV